MSIFIRLAAMAALCAMLLFAAPARGQVQATSQADPAAWGLYVQLAGTTRQEPQGYRISWRWSEPGRELVEEYSVPRTGKVAHTATITAGATPGTLHMKGSSMGGKAWNGTVQPDGSVVYVGTGMLKLHFKAMLASDGAYEMRSVKLRDGAVVSVAEPANRYLAAGDSATAATAVASVAVAPVAVVPDAAAPDPTPAASPTLSVPAATAAATATPASPAATQSLPGWLDALDGKAFVGTSPAGGPFNLSASREGDVLVLTSGASRLALRPGSTPGSFQLLEAWHDGSINANATAYIAGSAGAPASDPLDGYYADPRQPGDLVVSYDIGGAYLTLVFHPNAEGGFSLYQQGGRRTFGVRRAIGDPGYEGMRWYVPATQQAIERAHTYAEASRNLQEAQRREDEAFEADIEADRMQRAAAWEQTRAASEYALADSVARLNDTVASVEAQQAQYRARQQAAELTAAQARRQAEIDNARAATQRQEDQAAQYAAQRAAEQQRVAAAAPSPAAALTISDTGRAAAPAAASVEAAPKQMLGFCSGLTLGGFERDHEAVIYVSSIGPVDYAFGQPIEPLKEAYAAKLGVPRLIPDCEVSTDRAVLERQRQEAIDNRGYPNARRVMTGL